MKKNKQKILLLSIILFLLFYPIFSSAADKLIFFWGKGCSHCAKVESYIQQNKLDNIFNIERKEIYFDKKNREDFIKTCQEKNIPLEEQGVPMMIIDGQCIVGDQPIINALEAKLVETSSSNKNKINTNNSSQNNKNLTFPLVTGAAAVDAINPCAFAVLIILMSTILGSQQRKRALFAGLAFALAIYISYLLMGLGIYKALATANFSNWFMKFIAGLAIILGILNIKDYFRYGGGGFVMEVPRGWRPRMKSLIHSVTSPAGAFFIGFLVSLFLLPCTSGPYIVILGMLSQKETFYSALSWLLYYNLIFILPMIIITLAIYKGLNPQKAEEVREKRIRLLHLIAGLIMIAMGIIIFFKLI